MATNFPGSLDTSATLPAESAGTTLAVNHVTAHQNIQDAVEAIEAKVGVNSSAVTTTHDYKLSLVTGANKAVPNDSPTITGTVTLGTIQAASTTAVSLKNNTGGTAISFGGSGSTNSSTHGLTFVNLDSADYRVFSGGTGTITETATGSSTNISINLVPKGTGRLQSGGATVPTISTADTLTNKRITKRVLSLSANSATPSINSNLYDVVHITAQTAAITSFTSGLTGTPVDGDSLRISITGTTAVAVTWGTSFESSGGASLPTTTTSTTRLDVGFFWNTETSKWRCVAAI